MTIKDCKEWIIDTVKGKVLVQKDSIFIITFTSYISIPGKMFNNVGLFATCLQICQHLLSALGCFTEILCELPFDKRINNIFLLTSDRRCLSRFGNPFLPMKVDAFSKLVVHSFFANLT